VNRFEIETPSSASRPWPLLARDSMIAASSGRFATRTRPSSRSYQRKAGTPAAVPWRIACWLAGVVHGICTIHSWSVWEPPSTQRRTVGIVPELSAHCMTGKDTPSNWRNRTPSTSASGTCFGLIRSSDATNVSSVPAVRIQTRSVPKAAVIQAASTAVQKSAKLAPGTIASATCITIA
jgi:hypothetical protein